MAIATEISKPKPLLAQFVEVETARCTGHCCEKFTLPFSPAELLRRLEETRNPQPGGTITNDIEIIQPMVIYLGLSMTNAETGEPMAEWKHYYTCRNFDRATRNCRAYETRPTMCSDYPYGRVCGYRACTRTSEPTLVMPEARPEVAP